MAEFTNKVDFVALVSVTCANPNGDPINGNRPRTNYDGFGEMSDVCIKRKIRNRMQDLGKTIFVQSEDRADDGYKCLKKRAESVLKGITDEDEYAKKACEKWLDVRTFGQVFAFSGKKSDDDEGSSDEKDGKKGKGVSVGVRGPVSIHQAVSVSPVEVESLQITKSVNSKSDNGVDSDRIGSKHFVRYGLYMIKGSINVQLAKKTGFTDEDADVVKECLKTLFVNDSASARPDGSMEVVRLYWFKHNCESGQHPSAVVHRSIKVTLKEDVISPTSIDDYSIDIEPLEGLKPEVLNGM